MSSFAALLPPHSVKALVEQWLAEDTPAFDVGGFVVGDAPKVAKLYAKSTGVLAGVPFFDAVFAALGCDVRWTDGMSDGTTLDTSLGKIVCATVSGPARRVLLGERTALNVLARCSGIATRAHTAMALAATKRWHGRVAATRKTTPGFRLVEKYGAAVGGADTHRYDLSAMIMLKDNHIRAHGSITEAVRAARRGGGFAVKIEVECASLAEAEEAVTAGADVVMLDNFVPDDCKRVAAQLRAAHGERAKFIVEASGGIVLDSVASFMCSDIDVISMGSLTQGVPHVDFSLKIDG